MEQNIHHDVTDDTTRRYLHHITIIDNQLFFVTMTIILSTLTSRMSRLAIISTTTTRNIFTSSSSSAMTTIPKSSNPSPILVRNQYVHFNRYSNNNITQQLSSLSSIRCLSSMMIQPAVRTIDPNNDVTKKSNGHNHNNNDYGATSSLRPLFHTQHDAENFAAYIHANKHRKVKPFIFKKRNQQLKTYIGHEKNIRHSPWRMNLVCQLAHGLTVPEALKQLMFCQKVKAPLVAKVIRRTANLADIRDGYQPSQLEVAECFTTHGSHLKRLKIMGRGR
ncbi:hypothetical protein ACHAXM_008384 [Skeletonema potamos]|jgi:hypothetical protein